MKTSHVSLFVGLSTSLLFGAGCLSAKVSTIPPPPPSPPSIGINEPHPISEVSIKPPLTQSEHSPQIINAHSKEDEYSFSYPDSYVLQELPKGRRDSPSLIGASRLLEKKVEQELETMEATEGPPGIYLLTYTNPSSTPSLTWAQNYIKTNNILLPAEGAHGLRSTTVGGRDAATYTSIGLFNAHEYVIAHKDHIHVFTIEYQNENDSRLADFAALLQSIKFNK